AKHRVERCHVVRHQRLLVTGELPCYLGDDLRSVDFHPVPPRAMGFFADATPHCSSVQATRSAISSRQGAAMTCTPIGIGTSATGTATTGRPMKEIGCV